MRCALTILAWAIGVPLALLMLLGGFFCFMAGVAWIAGCFGVPHAVQPLVAFAAFFALLGAILGALNCAAG